MRRRGDGWQAAADAFMAIVFELLEQLHHSATPGEPRRRIFRAALAHLISIVECNNLISFNTARMMSYFGCSSLFTIHISLIHFISPTGSRKSADEANLH